MSTLTPELSAYAQALRADLSSSGAVDEILVDMVVMAALRLKVLHADPRAIDPFDPIWIHAYGAAIRAFFRAYDSLNRRRPSFRRSSTPPPARKPAAPAPPAISRTTQATEIDHLLDLDGPPLTPDENRKIVEADIAFLESVGRPQVAAMLRAELDSMPPAQAPSAESTEPGDLPDSQAESADQAEPPSRKSLGRFEKYHTPRRSGAANASQPSPAPALITPPRASP